MTNVGTAVGVVSLLRRQQGIDPVEGVPGQRNIVLEPGQSYEARVHAVDGRGFSLRWQSDGVLDIGDEFHTWVKPAGCTGDGLPVTGTRIGYLISAGVLIAILGLLLTYATRRRPVTNRA